MSRLLYEHRTQPLLTRTQFARRVLRHLGVALVLISVALGIGVLGYHFLGELGWLDALVNAAMILGGMGPVDPLKTSGIKVFAAVYALFSGLMFIGVASVLVAPFAHRLIHRFHLQQ